MRRLVSALTAPLAAALLAATASAQTPRDSSWITDGLVLSIAGSATRTFVGGYFNRVGPRTPGLATMDPATCMPEGRSHASGLVRVAIPDGAGGWYIAGDFTTYDDQPRSGLARIDANGELLPWAPLVSGVGNPSYVNALLLTHGNLYVGGRFGAIGAQPCFGLAAIDTSTGAADGWAPDAKFAVAALAASGDTLYVGGSFRLIGSEMRPCLAAFDLANGALLPTSMPGPQALATGTGVTSLATAPGILFAGGTIPYIGAPTGAAAVVDTVTGLAGPPLLDLYGSVRAVIPDGTGGWYVGGSFTQMRGVPALHLVHIDASGAPNSWAPAPNDTVQTLLLKGDTLFVGGSFTTIGGEARSRFAAYRASTGELLPGTLGANAYVSQMALSGDRLVLAGGFTTFGGYHAPSIAAIDCETFAFAARQPWWGNSAARSLLASGTQVYVGGDFSQVRSNTPYFLLTDASGLPTTNPSPLCNSTVSVVVPDGSGGWYVGGSFAVFGALSRRGLVHVHADGTPDAGFDAHVEGISSVAAIARVGDTLYVGGSFTSIGGVARSNLAAVSASTGALLAWNCAVDGSVSSIAVGPGTVYVSGWFTTVGTQARTNYAAIDAGSGGVKPWSVTTSYIYGLPGWGPVLYAGGLVYVGGLFTTIQGVSRSCFAALDPVTAVPTSLNLSLPPGFSIVDCFAISGNVLHVGGSFTSVMGHARTNYACVNLATAAVMTPAPNPDGRVRALSLDGNSLYVGGDFGSIGGQQRRYAAELNASTGFPLAFSTGVDQPVSALARSGSIVALGGHFLSSDSLSRRGVMAIDPQTGIPTSFAPVVAGDVRALAISGDRLYLGGTFTTVGGLTRRRLAAVTTSGAVTSWAPNPTASVYALALHGSRIYAGGEAASGGFLAAYDRVTGTLTPWSANPSGAIRVLTSAEVLWAGGNCSGVGGWTRSHLFAVSAASSTPFSFAPRLEKRPYQLTVAGPTLYAGGPFSAVNDTARYSLAAFGLTTGQMLPWNPDLRATVNSFALSGDTLFAGGAFTTAGGADQKYFAAVSASTGAPLGIRSSANASVQALSVSNGRLLASGAFTSIGMQPRTALAAFGPDGRLLPWDAKLTGTVNALVCSGDRVYAGGTFWRFDAPARQFAAAFDTATAGVLPWAPEPNSTVLSFLPNGGTVLIGGDFTQVGASSRRNLVEVDTSLGAATAWDPNPNNRVMSLSRRGSRLFVGGDFTTIGGQSRSRLASLDATSGLADSWNPGANGRVNTLLVTDTMLYVGGTFTTIAGQSRRVLAALDPVSGSLRSWNPGINAGATSVGMLDLKQGWLFVGGNFASFGNGAFARTGIAALDPATAATLPWVANASAEVTSIAHRDGLLWLGGYFTTLAGQSHTSLARLTDPTWQLELLDAPPVTTPGTLALGQNFPNPFRARSMIRFALPSAAQVRLALYDLQGREALVLLDEVHLAAGTHEVAVSTASLRAGVYWYRLRVGDRTLTRQLVTLR